MRGKEEERKEGGEERGSPHEKKNSFEVAEGVREM